jgi:hypothetical protein
MSLRRFHFAAIALAALAACSATAAVAGPWALAPGEYYTELSGSTFSTSSYYDQIGTRVESGGFYEQRGLTSTTELGWKKSWSLQMSMPLLSNTVRDGAGNSATSSGLGDFGVGLRYALRTGAVASSIQMGWTAPAGYNRSLPPGLGSGLQRLEASFEMGMPIAKLGFAQAGAGWAYDYYKFGSRGSDTDTTKTESELEWSDHLLIHGAAGVWLGDVLVAGLYDAEIGRRGGHEDALTTTQLVGTRFIYRVDERLDAFAGSWHSPGGENVLHINEFYAGVAWKLTKLNRLQGFLGGNTRP